MAKYLGRIQFILVVVVSSMFSGAGVANDWPQWRGPNRDGVVAGVTFPSTWPTALKEEWKSPLGEGYSSPVVVSGRAYVFSRHKDHELLQCLEVATGKELWHTEPYAA